MASFILDPSRTPLLEDGGVAARLLVETGIKCNILRTCHEEKTAEGMAPPLDVAS